MKFGDSLIYFTSFGDKSLKYNLAYYCGNAFKLIVSEKYALFFGIFLAPNLVQKL